MRELNSYFRAERRAAPKPARHASLQAGVPSGDRSAYPLNEGHTCY